MNEDKPKINIQDSVIYNSDIKIEGLDEEEVRTIVEEMLKRHQQAIETESEERESPPVESDKEQWLKEDAFHELIEYQNHQISEYGTSYEKDGQHYFEPRDIWGLDYAEQSDGLYPSGNVIGRNQYHPYGEQGHLDHPHHQEKGSLAKSLIGSILRGGLF